jgi:glycosyltransferase involved in cell wall biosynthesis
LFVLPSRAENFGSAMFEAMACGLPVVISTGVDLHADVIAAGAGLAVPLDVEALAEALILMVTNREMRENCAKVARSVAKSHSSARTAERLLYLYDEILASAVDPIAQKSLTPSILN